MRALFAVASIGVIALMGTTPHQTANLLLKGECGDTKACVPMILNYGEIAEKALVRSSSLPNGYTEFTLQVHGRLAGAQSGAYLLSLRGYTDGIKCCDFGQANAAVIGYAEGGEPVLLTSQGPLALTDDSLEVGCPACIKVTDAASGRIVASYSSPSWDLSLTGHREAEFVVGDSGELFLNQGGSCVRVFRDAMFKVVEHSRCTGKPLHHLKLNIDSGACT